MLLFLFGLPGVGKTFIGKLLQQKYGACFWDGDEALDEKMIAYIYEEIPFTTEMTEKLTETMIRSIEEKLATIEKDRLLVVAQAMLIEKDRRTFTKKFKELQFIQVKSDPALADKRIESRNNWVTPKFAENIRKSFKPYQAEADNYPALINNSDSEAIYLQIESLLPHLKRHCLTTIGTLGYFAKNKDDSTTLACAPSSEARPLSPAI